MSSVASIPINKQIGFTSSYTPAKFRYLMAVWVARYNRPFNILEDETLIEMFTMLNSSIDEDSIPHRTTRTRDLVDFHAVAVACVSVALQSLPSKLTLCLDGWTSPQSWGWVGITVHYESNGTMRNFGLDFIKYVFLISSSHCRLLTILLSFRTTATHTGAEIAKCVYSVAELFKILDKIHAMGTDGASANGTTADALEGLRSPKDGSTKPPPPRIDTLASFRGRRSRFLCTAHGLSLSAGVSPIQLRN